MSRSLPHPSSRAITVYDELLMTVRGLFSGEAAAAAAVVVLASSPENKSRNHDKNKSMTCSIFSMPTRWMVCMCVEASLYGTK